MEIKDTDVPGTMTLSIGAPKDAKGKDAKVQGVPAWFLDDNTNCQIVSQSADGLSAVVHVGDNPSATQVSVKADADLGDGVTELVSVFVINVVPGDAVSLGDITASAITPDP